jgi:serine protease Do
MNAIPLIVLAATLAGAPYAWAQAPVVATPPQAVMAIGPNRGASIGVRTRDAAPDAARGGAVIDAVYDNTPAKTAGVHVADVVIEFDGERVRSSRQLARLVQETPPGREVKMIVQRSGRNVDLTITPERDRLAGTDRWEPGMRVEPGVRIDSPRFRAQIGPFEWDRMRPRARLGATVEEMTPQLAGFFGASRGLLVSSVIDNSPAARAGLRTGDVITAVNGQRVDGRDDLVDVLARANDGDEVALSIVRDKREATLTAKVERWETRRESLD